MSSRKKLTTPIWKGEDCDDCRNRRRLSRLAGSVSVVCARRVEFVKWEDWACVKFSSTTKPPPPPCGPGSIGRRRLEIDPGSHGLFV